MTTFATLASGADMLERLDGSSMPPVMGAEWVELYKAILLHDLFVKRNKPRNGLCNLGNPYRLLAGCAGVSTPSQVTPDRVQLSFNVALGASESGQWARLLKGLMGTWFDTFQLADIRPLAPYCIPFPDNAQSRSQADKLTVALRRQIDAKRPDSLRSDLSRRHYEEKLPRPEAMVELARIIFSESPRTTSDFIRFHQARILAATGFRVGEMVNLPAATLVVRDNGIMPGRRLGPAEPITSLVHFAEKQHQDGPAQEFVEATHHVPNLLAPIVREAVAAVLKVTAPQRQMLQRQHEEKRLFVGLQDDDLVPWAHAYRRMSGMMQISQEPIPAELQAAYRSTYDPTLLAEMRAHQDYKFASIGPHRQVREYFRRMEDASQRPVLRRADGETFRFANWERNDGSGVYIRAGDMEKLARQHLQLKLPDTRTVQTGSRTLYSYDFLFLFPGKVIAEEKYGSIVDIDSYFSVKVADRFDFELQLGGKNAGLMFRKYGADDDARRLSANPHSLRHLQTNELFRAGVADTIITKRFNRTSVAQSYHYDHRSTSERLEEMEPQQMALAEDLLGPKARQAFELIRARRIQGPIVKEFLTLQENQGDDVAFRYLNAEAGALHYTPYGFCLNSFAASPCLKHLECFNKCSQLVRTSSSLEKTHLEKLKGRFELHISQLRSNPSKAPHFEAHLEHAITRLSGVEAALATAPNEPVFPTEESRYLAPR
ncbi:hypothetical protein [uncultured Brevundimonas sp.]|uniref:hypothetical protein n=1 Tax=uncultured Brevundimonas sp. TaxID=213418 RepID=UPI0025EC1891|nr:hypothetical protein [uncultured Brevundimonas sp.]